MGVIQGRAIAFKSPRASILQTKYGDVIAQRTNQRSPQAALLCKVELRNGRDAMPLGVFVGMSLGT